MENNSSFIIYCKCSEDLTLRFAHEVERVTIFNAHYVKFKLDYIPSFSNDIVQISEKQFIKMKNLLCID